ncbi:hypothetical protein SEEH0300_08664 [Salmonella enterica subsp. enterica serovar Heidelberg str. 76-0300]|nr:hypothetical protein SEEH0300_08664 [Salmonella enterica subsp. enterica serovar Heidelberg str. 76-0300]
MPFYTFYTPPANFCRNLCSQKITFLRSKTMPLEVLCECRRDNRHRAGFLTLGYLVYALINAEAF